MFVRKSRQCAPKDARNDVQQMKTNNQRRTAFSLTLVHVLCLLAQQLYADTLPVVRAAVLQFGTVNWELDVIKHHGLDRKYSFTLEVLPLGSTSAVNVALQGGAADIIVNDWIWVSRQRDEDKLYTFVPYSLAVGELIAHPNSGIKAIADLPGKKLGIAGGPVDKSWLTLRAYAMKTLNLDLVKEVTTQFAAPPLLNELVTRGELDAVLNYWHYTARLRATGMPSVINVETMLKEFRIGQAIPLLGWVFHEPWASENQSAVTGFLQASYHAKNILLQSDDEWKRIRPLMKVENENVAKTLRDAFRDGIPRHFGTQEQAGAAQLFSILAEQGGGELTGSSTELNSGTFWSGFEVRLPHE